MRVTESRLIEASGVGVAKARERTGAATDQVSSGVRVTRPSEDTAAWAEGMRASAQKVMSESRGSAIGHATERLEVAETALITVEEALNRTLELAIQLGNDTYDAAGRALGAEEVRALREQILAAANVSGLDGEFLFAGSRGGTTPFDAAGLYQGDAVTRSIEVQPGETQTVSLSGAIFTAASGVDLIPTLDALITALSTGNGQGIRDQIAPLNVAVGQVADARGAIGTRLLALEGAETARQDFEVRLEESRARLLGADPVKAATEFQESRLALETARAVAEQIIALSRPR